jgi:hypothetical protein
VDERRPEATCDVRETRDEVAEELGDPGGGEEEKERGEGLGIWLGVRGASFRCGDGVVRLRGLKL